MMKKILITGPSLDPSVNVSGISSVVMNIVACDDFLFSHFQVGKTDASGYGWRWIVAQFVAPFRLCFRQMSFKPDITHVNMPLNVLAMIRDGVIIILSWVFSTQIIVHLHGGRHLKKEKSGWLLSIFVRSIFGLTDKIIVLSDNERVWLVTEFSIPNNKIVVIANAVNIPDTPITRSKAKPVVFLFIGRIVESKGVFLLEKAFEDLNYTRRNQFRFILGGTGPEVSQVVKGLSEILADSFSYVGVLNGARKEQAYIDSDFFVLPSLHGEGLPMALLEAMSYGLVPLTTDDGAMGDLVSEKTGFLVEKASVKALSAMLEKAISTVEAGTYCQLSYDSRALISKKFNVEDYSREIRRLYDYI